ncbi:MAG: hypothetical protein ABIQ97_07015 [Lysobacteraceae bacterium]
MLLSIAASATTMLKPPKIEELAGAWIGPDDGIAYFRLEIDKAGRGLLVIQEGSEDGYFSYYKISRTILSNSNNYKISFALLPLKLADPTVTLSGEANTGELRLVRSGINHGYKWHRSVSLEREDYLLPRIHAVKEASATFHAQPER